MPVPTRSIYVGNIPFSSSVESLMEAFAEYEPISVKLVEGRGVAFIEVPARRAFGMVRDTDGSKLEGRLLSVSIARPRENEPTYTQEQSRGREGFQRTESRPGGPQRNGYEGARGEESQWRPTRPPSQGGREDRSYGGGGRFDSRNDSPRTNDRFSNRPRASGRPPFAGRGGSDAQRPDYSKKDRDESRREWSDRDASTPDRARPQGEQPELNRNRRFSGDSNLSGERKFDRSGQPGKPERPANRPNPGYGGRPGAKTDGGAGKPRKFFKKK